MRASMKIVFLIAIFSFFSAGLYCQNFIGMHKDEIIKIMDASHKNFKLNTSNVNPHYKYLKYEDRINEITVLYFLSDENECTLVRKMYDYSNINDVIRELNEKYKKTGKNTWEYKYLIQKYCVELTEGEWFFTVTIKKK
ncbi:MAG: hypothetical protein JXB24_10820 [Bacteroidales bacterium]|nr:hypothetical protein [Bacteroidales bacterium]